MIVYEKGITVTINRSGRVRLGIACIEEAGKILSAHGIQQAIIPAEIYVDDGTKRTRVNDLLTALADKNKTGTLKLAAFDILEIDHAPFRPVNYTVTHKKLVELLTGAEKVHPVEMETARSKEDVKKLYSKWVEKEGPDGLVVYSELPFIFKIKPRHNLDLVVIGFTEGTGNQQGQARTLLLAFIPKPGYFQVAGKIGGGMPVEMKKKLFKQFSALIIDSDYIETDSNHVAFHMIRPEIVIEISINDVLYEGSTGEVKQNSVLEISRDRYRLHSTVDGVSFIAPLFERIRTDKKADADDVRLSQLDNFAYLDAKPTTVQPKQLPQSELLLREVYIKELGNKVMVQKYLVWKTNKEKWYEYPAYVCHYTNFSSERQQPLQREVYISDSEEQIFELQRQAVEANVKKGWIKVEPVVVKAGS